MEKLPLLGAIRTFCMTVDNDLKDAIGNKEWGIIALTLFIWFVLIAVSVAGAISIIGSGVEQLGKFFPSAVVSNMAPKTLTYFIATTTKDKDGLYETIFNVPVHTPAGNGNEITNIQINIPLLEVDCKIANSVPTISDINGGIASTTQFFRYLCITRQPIIDTGTLFKLIQ